MSRRSRIFTGILVVYLAAVAFLLYRVTADLDPRYRESAEESLVDTAQLLATLLERKAYDGIIPIDDLERTLDHLERRPVYAKIFEIEKTNVDLHVYVTDKNGTVLFDSKGQDVGADYLAWRDVNLTLAGAYGARTTLAEPGNPRSAVMYVGAAIRERREGMNIDASEDIIGMIAVGKPIAAISPFIANARAKIMLAGALAVAAFAALMLIAVVWLVRPFGLVRDVWRAFWQGRTGFAAPISFLRRLLNALRTAFAEARDTIAGRSYVDQYVQTLAHEMKSPLAAIRGAAELLREPMPEDTRNKFTGNIEEQVGRAQDLIDRMLELSSLERRGALERTEPVSMQRVLQTVADELAAVAARKAVRLQLDVRADGIVTGDIFLLQRAVSNLARNAIDFSPANSSVTMSMTAGRRKIELTVRDHGPGLPDYASARLFEKFFSLPRPDTGRKGTGLGLAFVKEIAALHGGSVSLNNHREGGAIAALSLPKS